MKNFQSRKSLSKLLTILTLTPVILNGAACASSNPTNADYSAALAASSTTEEWPQSIAHSSGRDWSWLDPSRLQIQSISAVVVTEDGKKLYAKNPREIRPIASITKLMTAMIVLDAGVSLNTTIGILEADRDRLRNSSSRLRIGEAALTRGELITVALMSSDNRAAHALARTTFRGGTQMFIAAMNRKAHVLGMNNTFFADSSGLDGRNHSTAEDLIKMIAAASHYPFIRGITAHGELTMRPFADGNPLLYRNTNPLVRNPDWNIEISKTGYINESGHGLVMQVQIAGQRIRIALLGASSRAVPVNDAIRLRNWLTGKPQTVSR